MYKELLNISKVNLTTTRNITQIGSFEIPPSYLQFAQEIGFGRLLGLFLTYIPMGENTPYCDALEHRNAHWKEIFQMYLKEYPDRLFLKKEADNKERLANAEPFLFSENGEVVFWDSRNRDDKGECPIYLVDFSTGIYLAGNTFKEFILNLTDKAKVKSILKFEDDPLLRTFDPLPLKD